MKRIPLILILTKLVFGLPSAEILYETLPSGTIRCRFNCGRVFADQCPPVDCPPPVKPPLNRICGVPNCSITTLRIFLFPHIDPNKFYQCRPKNSVGEWEVIERKCGCETYFDYDEQRCVHPFEWVNQCSGTSSVPPAPIACIPECPTCGESTTVSSTSTTQSTTRSTDTTSSIASTIITTTLLVTSPSTSSTTTTSTTTSEPTITSTNLPTQTQEVTIAPTTLKPCNCFCWCPCRLPDRCWFPCACNLNNCSC